MKPFAAATIFASLFLAAPLPTLAQEGATPQIADPAQADEVFEDDAAGMDSLELPIEPDVSGGEQPGMPGGVTSLLLPEGTEPDETALDGGTDVPDAESEMPMLPEEAN